MAKLWLDGVEMPKIALNGIKYGYDRIWSTKTGRVNTGEMEGTIVAKKRKITIKFVPLKFSEKEKIVNAIYTLNAFIPFKLVTNSGENISFTGYTGDFEITQGWDRGDGRYDGVEINVIQK